MRADEFAELFAPHVRKKGETWTARCRAHDDGQRQASWSLSIKEGDDGKVLVKCHAGCPVESIVASVGRELVDLFDDQGLGKAAHSRRATQVTKTESATGSPQRAPVSSSGKVECVYEYKDEAGELLFQAVRYREPKGFRQRRRDNGKWTWDLKDVRRVLYRLPELLAAAAEGRAAWWPEGEKDADALVALGFVATTNAMGAGSLLDEYAAPFAGCARVLIPTDSDDAGRKSAHAKARLLWDAGIKPKVFDVGPGRDDGYDVSDFIAEAGDEAADRLRELAKAAPVWTPQIAERVFEAPLGIVSVQDFARDLILYDDAKDYLGSFLHGGYRVHVAGPIGHGKTSFMLEAESAALRGEDFLGIKGKGGLRILHVDLEMSDELLLQAVHDARLDDVEGFDLWHLPDGMAIDTNSQDRRKLERACDEGYDIITLDPWYKLVEQELEYSSTRYVVSLLDGIRARHPMLCMMIGFHAQEPPRPKAPITMGCISGFKVWHRAADIVVSFQRTGGDTSRVMWLKERGPRPNAKQDEKWLLEWERGLGFRRVEDLSARSQVMALVTGDWQATETIREAWGRSSRFTRDVLTLLAQDGKIDERGSDSGGPRGKTWRLHEEGDPDGFAF